MANQETYLLRTSTAVEAQHPDNLFPYQVQPIPHRRDFIGVKPDGTTMYDTMMPQIKYAALPLSTSSSTMPQPCHEVILPPVFYQSSACDQNLPVKSDSSLTSFKNSMPGASRKRSRDLTDYACGMAQVASQKIRLLATNQNIARGTRQHQSDLDRLIAQETERMRLEVEQKVRQQYEELMKIIGEGIARTLRAKDEEIQRMGKLNWAMQERINTLCLENQLLRGFAQKSEAAATFLRSNLEQVLAAAHAMEDCHPCSAASASPVEEDAKSCCASSSSGRWEAKEDSYQVAVEAGSGSRGPRGKCRGCWAKEPCVLLLPCRHLCLCTTCGSVYHGCPVCGSVMTGTVHVNMS